MPRATFEPLTCGRALLGHWDGNDLPASPSAVPTKPRTGNLFAVSNNASRPRPFAKPHGALGECAHSRRLRTMIRPGAERRFLRRPFLARWPVLRARRFSMFVAFEHEHGGKRRREI